MGPPTTFYGQKKNIQKEVLTKEAPLGVRL